MFFQGFTWQNILIFLAVVVCLILLNEITRRNKWVSLAFYILLPICLGIFVWPKTAIRGNDDWFPLVKTISSLVGVIGFMAIRYIPKLYEKKWPLIFPFAILSINIFEAILRDFEVYASYNGQSYMNPVDGLMMQGGPWNIINGIAGIILIITITGWLGIRVSKNKSKDMVWADQLWFWILAYDFWNMAYCYNCISTRSIYAGLALLIACTFAEFVLKRGVWLQHRAQTLALWAMFSITFSNYAKSPLFGITSSYNTVSLLVLSIIALVANVGVLGYEIYKIIRTKRNPITKDLYIDTKSYKKNMNVNGLI